MCAVFSIPAQSKSTWKPSSSFYENYRVMFCRVNWWVRSHALVNVFSHGHKFPTSNWKFRFKYCRRWKRINELELRCWSHVQTNIFPQQWGKLKSQNLAPHKTQIRPPLSGRPFTKQFPADPRWVNIEHRGTSGESIPIPTHTLPLHGFVSNEPEASTLSVELPGRQLPALVCTCILIRCPYPLIFVL